MNVKMYVTLQIDIRLGEKHMLETSMRLGTDFQCFKGSESPDKTYTQTIKLPEEVFLNF